VDCGLPDSMHTQQVGIEIDVVPNSSGQEALPACGSASSVDLCAGQDAPHEPASSGSSSRRRSMSSVRHLRGAIEVWSISHRANTAPPACTRGQSRAPPPSTSSSRYTSTRLNAEKSSGWRTSLSDGSSEQSSERAAQLLPKRPWLRGLLVLIYVLWLCSIALLAVALEIVQMERFLYRAAFAMCSIALLAALVLVCLVRRGENMARQLAHAQADAHAYIREQLQETKKENSIRVSALHAKLSELTLANETIRALYQRRQGEMGHGNNLRKDMRESLLEAPPQVVITADPSDPAVMLHQALQGKVGDTGAAKRAASRMRDPKYSLRSFYSDVRHAFPELALYTTIRESNKTGQTDVSSGVTSADEYRRTIGALFCVYWLARIGIDGERGFSFGVDDEWLPCEPSPPDPNDSIELEKRREFYEKQEWAQLQELLVDSSMLERNAEGHVRVVPERMGAALALTAFHDVMKVEALLPVVHRDHAPYNGFKEGDKINDHDLALAYVLDFYGSSLPSFAALSPSQQRSVRFTQSKMAFNHGWLVQAEAPPDALFRRFKEVIANASTSASDIAFYFVHWLTDLAGACPTPLEGCEKFVLKFPQPVLGSFIRSFSTLNELATNSETEVFEHYLCTVWRENSYLGPIPTGDSAIALMRLIVQAQARDKQLAILDAFECISADDRACLSEEMARTGCADQKFSRSTCRQQGGPAILVYYSPAFIRSLIPAETLDALRLLAEVYRRSRALWPLSPSGNYTVTVRVDQIKELSLADIQSVYADGESWLLAKRNDLEAVVERHPLDYMSELMTRGVHVRLLKFWRRKRSPRQHCAPSGNSSSPRGNSSSPPSPSTPFGACSWRKRSSNASSNLSSPTSGSVTPHSVKSDLV